MGSEIPDYDEDLDEAFAGPFNPDELEDLEELNETWDDEYEEESTRLLASGGVDPLPESPQSYPGGGSAFTQLGAVPGSATFEGALPGSRDFEPGEPLQSGTVEFAPSSGDETHTLPAEGTALPLPGNTNPDGSPIENEIQLLGELQRVQRDIARRRQERVQRQQALERQLAEARLQLQREIEEDMQMDVMLSPPRGDPASLLPRGSEERHQGGRRRRSPAHERATGQDRPSHNDTMATATRFSPGRHVPEGSRRSLHGAAFMRDSQAAATDHGNEATRPSRPEGEIAETSRPADRSAQATGRQFSRPRGESAEPRREAGPSVSRSRPLTGAPLAPQGLGLAPVQLFRDGELIPEVPRGAGTSLVPNPQGSEVAELDPAWQTSQLYAAQGVGRQPGVPTQQEREAKVRASIPGGDKELPSEIRRSSAEPDSAQRLLLSEVAAQALQWANLSPETKKLRMMQQEVTKIANGEGEKKGERVLQNADFKFAGASTDEHQNASDTPEAGAVGSSVQEKFFETMTSFVEVMKEKESGGSILKWDRKPPVIKAETPKGFMTEIVDLERLFSELGYKTQRKRWGVFRSALQGKGKEKLEYELERIKMMPERIAQLFSFEKPF